MPVVQLEDNSGANLGSALGAVGGYLATKKTRDADKATAAADKARTNAREDSAAALNAKKVQGEIDATQHKSQADDASALERARQQHVFEQLSETVKDGPPKGMDPRMWAAQLQNQANASGLTDEKLRSQLIATGQAVVAARAPKLADVTHGMQPLKPTDKPEVAVKHWMDAASTVANSDMPEDQKKAAIAMYQKNAADALARVPKPAPPMSDYQREELGLRKQEVGIRQQEVNKPREGRQPSAQEKYFMEHGYSPPSYAEAHPKDKPAAKKSPSEIIAADFAQAKAVYDQPGSDKNAIINQFAVTHRLKPQDAKAYFR